MKSGAKNSGRGDSLNDKAGRWTLDRGWDMGGWYASRGGPLISRLRGWRPCTLAAKLPAAAIAHSEPSNGESDAGMSTAEVRAGGEASLYPEPRAAAIHWAGVCGVEDGQDGSPGQGWELSHLSHSLIISIKIPPLNTENSVLYK
ncbi:hypothetical protein GGTG_10479 [Gaeumannomyces tritici R3-111a-1]|uniref:Uncharacterized protein n=1 Tax=Gaeumannomyces tritici (strain R3-111a-1) TaxID=644352 RepID=J3PAF3_GAET3|nr:hypothetical protein GGTG_10479 [Gaeumannomyces tritici R3-111a-1]EJT71219.1 hypothetical protein GGTG_10479 [Gaeumannomyces tritici R3-111a-1]